LEWSPDLHQAFQSSHHVVGVPPHFLVFREAYDLNCEIEAVPYKSVRDAIEAKEVEHLELLAESRSSVDWDLMAAEELLQQL